MTDYKLTKENSKTISIRVPLNEVDTLKAKFKEIRDNGEVHVNIDKNVNMNVNMKTTIKGLISFLNEIKDTYFPREKFKDFMEILQRYMTMDDLANLEVELL